MTIVRSISSSPAAASASAAALAAFLSLPLSLVLIVRANPVAALRTAHTTKNAQSRADQVCTPPRNLRVFLRAAGRALRKGNEQQERVTRRP